MPLTGNVPHDIKAEKAAGKPQEQAVAIALSEHRKVNGGHDSEDEILKDYGNRISLVKLRGGSRYGMRVGNRTTEYKTEAEARRVIEEYVGMLRGDSLLNRLDSMSQQLNGLGARAAAAVKRVDAGPPRGTVVQEVGKDWKIYRSPNSTYAAYNARTGSTQSPFLNVSDAETWIRGNRS